MTSIYTLESRDVEEWNPAPHDVYDKDVNIQGITGQIPTFILANH